MQDTFEKLVAAYHNHESDDANACVAKGIERRLDDLPDPSRTWIAGHAEQARSLLARFRTLREHVELDFDQALDVELAELSLEAEVHRAEYRFSGRTTHEQMPTAGTDIGNGLFLLMISDPRAAEDRLANITRRLEKVPAYLAALRARLEYPVKRWAQMDLQKTSALPTLFEALTTWAEQIDWPDVISLRRARQGAEVALLDYSRALGSMPTTDDLHVGDAIARRIVKLRGIDVPLEQLHAWARAFLSDTSACIEELRGRLCTKYGLSPDSTADELQAELNRHFRLQTNGHFSVVLKRYEDELERLRTFVRARDLFPLLDDERVIVLQTPPFMEPSIPAGAMMSPPPFRTGVRTSLVYLTLSEALLDEHTEVTIPSMMIHEAIPGHHLQLATASKHPSVVRRHTEAMDQAEGWTTMLEDYMLEVGYAADLADEVRFCMKRDIGRLAARVAIDLFFMTGDRGYLDLGVDCDTSSSAAFGAAAPLLATITGFVPERIEAELNWYSQERGYPLSYLTGNRLVWQLKRDVQTKTNRDGVELDRLFHREFLACGNMPLSFVRRVFKKRGLVA